MKLSEYAKYDGLGLAELVKSRQISPRELAETALAAIDKLNGEINAVIGKTPEEMERTLGEGPASGCFEGVPFLIKDIGAHYANVPMECASRLFSGYAPPHDSELAARFKRSGLVLVGRSNAPEFGDSISTEPVKNGPTRNPWNFKHSPGGSSGGAAAAVASGMVPVAHANDGGGSIRIPASCCGVFGLKPTRGRQTWGPDNDEFMFGFGCEHIVSRSVRDSAAMLDATAGPDVGERHLLPKQSLSFWEASKREPKKLRIAFSITSPAGAPKLHEDCKRAVLETAKLCEDLGHEVFEAAPDITHEESCAVWRDAAAPFLAAVVREFCQATGRVVGEDSVEATSRALYEYGLQMRAVDIIGALNMVNMISRRLGKFFLDCDLWLSPIMTSPPPVLGVLNANEEGVSADGWIKKIFDVSAFCTMFNISGQPAMSVPLHWTKDGLPIGVQFAARFAEEETLFSLAGQLERAQPWINRVPPL